MRETFVHDVNLLPVYIDATEVTNCGAIWLNEKGIIVGANHIFAKKISYPKEQFAGKMIFEIDPYLSMMDWRSLWKRLLKHEEVVREAQYLTANEDLCSLRLCWKLVELSGEKFCCGVVQPVMSSSRYEDLLNIASEISRIAAWEWDLDQDEFFFTTQLRSLLSIPEDFVFNKYALQSLISKKLPSKTFEYFSKKLSEAIKAGQFFEMELDLKLNDNQGLSTVNLTVKPIFIDNKTTKLYGTVQDLSNISKRTNELYLLQHCMEYAQECLLWVDQEGKVIYSNQAAALTYDYTKEEFLNKTIFDFVPSLNPSNYSDQWKELAEGGMAEAESIHKKNDGSLFPAWVQHNFIAYQGKTFNCVFIRDLTDQKEQEERLRITQLSVDKAQDMVFWLDDKANIFYANEKASQDLGYSSFEIQNINLFKIAPGRTKAEWPKFYKKIKKEQHLMFESLMKRKNGKVFPVEVSLNHFKYEEKEIISSHVRDITERKAKGLKLEMAYEQIKQLKEEAEIENTILKDEIHLEYSFKNIISTSKNYKQVLKKVEQVADSDATVLILGETGTGKELLARAVHQLSDRAGRAMIKVNCGALPANLIESELFGHEKGAFTGAYQAKKGRFELADKGTIFLDEIGELPLDLQSKLLRVLQEGEFEKLGGTKTIKVNVRVITATNRDLEQKVSEKEFREDLFYRLNVFPIYNIPLRERREDIPLLVRFFVDKYSKKMGKKIKEIPQLALKKLESYDFPGNVRELENIVERSIILTNNERLSFDTALFRSEAKGKITFPSLDDIQKNHIIEALRRTRGRVSGSKGAAVLLKMNDKTLVSRMKKLNIDKKDYLS